MGGEFSILDLFDEDYKKTLRKKSDGSFVGRCPSCGNEDDNYGVFFINPKTNSTYCMGSKTKFNITQTMLLVRKEITCFEGDEE